MPLNSKASMMSGSDIWMSAMRIISASNQPPAQPQARPIAIPTAAPSPTLAKPTNSEIRLP